ncbi:MGS-like domain-containing protein, partial [Fibrobacter sp. UWH6]
GNRIPDKGNIFVSLKDEDKERAVPLIKKLADLGYGIYATRGTSTILFNAGIKTRAVFRISRGRPNLLDLIHDNEVQWIVNTSETGAEAMVDEIQMRSKAVVSGVPITTTIAALTSTVEGLMDKYDYGRFEVCSLQEYHRHIVK